MKVRIEARPGEISDHDLRDIAEALSKAKAGRSSIKQGPKELDYAVLRETVDRSERKVGQIKREMLRRISKVLNEAS